MSEKPNITSIILAAGSSSRMGKIKQLLPWKKSTLLQYAIDQSLNSNAQNTLVVLGANREQIISEIYGISNIDIVENTNWKSGMLASLQEGLKAAIKDSDAIIALLADQPSITSKYINKIIDLYIDKRVSIVATKYKSTLGVPVLFSKDHFGSLLNLNQETQGAKHFINTNIEKTLSIEPDFKLYDIDTMEDYNKFYKIYS